MQQQPSAQGIASLYRGNPQPLQQSIQKDQQAKPGLPPDLQKMLALQIVTNETDSATAQKAMDQLRQMGGQSGKPPTVMASLQQQAEQKLQAQAVQAQQKQQGIQSLLQQAPAAGVPEGTPQPEDQPEAQGIDQLPVEFAAAEGGIVSFASDGEVPETDASEKDSEGIKKALKFVAGLPIEALKTLVSAPGYGLDKDTAPEKKSQPKETPAASSRKALNDVDAAMRAAPAAPAQDRKPLVAQRAPAPAPMAPAAAPEGSTADAYAAYMNRALTADRDAERTKEENRYATAGKQDLSQYDRLIAELDKRKQELAPKQGYEGLMEYLGQISANSQPGRGSFASGAAGARALDAVNKERQAQQFELTKQGVEIAQKKLDTDRAFSLDKYKAGQEGAKRIDDVAKDAAKEFGLDSRNEKTLANQIRVQLLQNQGSLAAASVRSEGRTELTAKDRATLADKAMDNVTATLKANVPMQMKAAKDPAYLQSLVRAETERLMAAAEGRTIAPAPGAAGPGGNTRMQFDAKGNLIK